MLPTCKTASPSDRRPWWLFSSSGRSRRGKTTRREIAEWFDPCRLREPVYAWLWANMAQVTKARRPTVGYNPMHWSAIARIMEFEGIKGSRGEPPNANSVRRVWGRVCQDFERQEDRKGR